MHELDGVRPGDQSRALWLSTLAFTICFAVWTIFSIIGVRIKQELAGVRRTRGLHREALCHRSKRLGLHDGLHPLCLPVDLDIRCMLDDQSECR